MFNALTLKSFTVSGDVDVVSYLSDIRSFPGLSYDPQSSMLKMPDVERDTDV